MNVQLIFKEKPLHLFGFPLLFIVNHFFAIVTNTTLQPFLLWWGLNFLSAVTLCSALTWLACWILSFYFNKTKSAILSTILFLPFFFFQDVFLSLHSTSFFGLRARWAVPALAIALIAIIYLISRSNKPFRSLNQYLNLVSILLVAYTGITLILSFDRLKPKVLNYSPQPRELTCINCPDVYLFVLDSYTSNKSLEDYFQFENSDFTNKLKNLSFEVAEQAESDYALTQYSVASILNFNEIKDLKDYNSGLSAVIQNSAVTESFKKSEYSINNYSLFQIDDQPPYYSITADVSIGFINGVIHYSIFNLFYDVILKNTIYETHENILNRINEHSEENGKPDFVYAHLFAPHPPFVIDKNGQEINFFKQTKSFNNKAAYISQVEGINKMIFSTIKKVRQSSPNAIIIIMGDHGYRYLDGDPNQGKESYTVFLAYHGPNQTQLNQLKSSNDIFNLIFKNQIQGQPK